jgi:tRNA G18 (ribose-2'-O)-methylase SpoU
MRYTNPNWPTGLEDSPLETRRNVIDHYSYWDEESIRADLDTKRTQLVIVCENFAGDFNLATVMRCSNAFVAGAFWIVGRRRYDKRGAVGTNHYEHIHYADSTLDVIKQHPDYKIVCVDNIENAETVDKYSWPEKTLLIFGQEQIGVSQVALDHADACVYIKQYGSVRSLNVGVAAGITINAYTTQHA